MNKRSSIIRQTGIGLISLFFSICLYGYNETDSIRELRIENLKTQAGWINPEAIQAYLNDIHTVEGESVRQQQYNTLSQNFPLLKELLEKESLTDQEVETLRNIYTGYRELLLSNPLLDEAEIIVARYNLQNRDRRAMGAAIGTAPTNYSSFFSGPRKGYDAEIIKLSQLKENPESQTIYKPALDVPVSELHLHWNGKQILFTSLDSLRRWQIYEVGTDGSGLRQMIVSEEPDLEFCDASYLPDGKLVATTNIGYNGVPCVHGEDIVANLVLYDPATRGIRRLTFDQDGNWSPTVLPNGRLMYTRWEYTDLTHYFSRIVMHMNPDGTENKALYGSGSFFPNSTFDMKPVSKTNSRFIGIISGHHGVARSGRLILFDPAKGRKEEKGMIQELPFSKRPIEPIIKDELVNGVWPQFMKPWPLNEKYYLVAGKLSPESLWGIYLVDIFDNLTLIAEEEGAGLTNPILLAETETPPIIPSKVNPADKESTVFIQDIYEGEGTMDVPRGTIKSLRIFAYEYAYILSPSDHDAQGIQSGWDIKRVLGTVPVEEDGSALFKIPANTPISIQPLDENGAAIQWMRSWFAGMPGEIVSCVGCHEDQNMIPIPKRTIASTIKPHPLEEPPGGVRPFTFRNEIQPVLDRNCISCHDGTTTSPDFRKDNMVLYERGRVTKVKRNFDQSYLNLHPYVYRQGPEADIYVLKPYEYYMNNSELIRILKAGHHGVEMSEEDWKTLYTWIDLNAPYFGAFTQLNDLNGIDQVKRRQELSEKYSGHKVNWQQEIEDYATWLKEHADRTPKAIPATKPVATKNTKVKNFPFNKEAAKQKQQGKTDRVISLAPGVEITLKWIPAGTFIMGNPQEPSASPAFKTEVKKGFWMSETEITNEQFCALFPEHDSRYIGQTWKDHTTPGYASNEPKQPVIRISWQEATDFCQKLSEKSGLSIKLPTETQWEWAARADSDTDFWFGSRNDNFGLYENLADSTLVDLAVTGVNPRPMKPDDPMRKFWDFQPKITEVNDHSLIAVTVASYQPNPWGLYDMNGNVAKWTRSDYQPYPLKENQTGDTQQKVVKGGSWMDRPAYANSAIRKPYYPWQRPFNVGFRIILEE